MSFDPDLSRSVTDPRFSYKICNGDSFPMLAHVDDYACAYSDQALWHTGATLQGWAMLGHLLGYPTLGWIYQSSPNVGCAYHVNDLSGPGEVDCSASRCLWCCRLQSYADPYCSSHSVMAMVSNLDMDCSSHTSWGNASCCSSCTNFHVLFPRSFPLLHYVYYSTPIPLRIACWPLGVDCRDLVTLQLHSFLFITTLIVERAPLTASHALSTCYIWIMTLWLGLLIVTSLHMRIGKWMGIHNMWRYMKSISLHVKTGTQAMQISMLRLLHWWLYDRYYFRMFQYSHDSWWSIIFTIYCYLHSLWMVAVTA